MTHLPSVLRAISAAILVAIGFDLASRETEATTVLDAEPDAVGALADALVSPAPPDRIVWGGPAGPSAAATLLLAPGPATPGLTLPVGPLPGLSVTAPERAVAGRAAVLDVAVRAAAGESVVVRWRGAVGDGDSTTVVPDERGVARAGLGVRPTRGGWQAWTVSAGPDTVEVGAWARPARPLRVRALVGTPGAESRYALRALEEAGMQVEAVVELGRADIASPSTDPSAADVWLLIGDPEVGAAGRAQMADFVASGGGVVLAPAGEAFGPEDATGALMAVWGLGNGLTREAALAAGDTVAWSLPATLSPLPAAPAPVRVATREAGTGRSVGNVDGVPVAILSTPGVGRVAWSGISESWRWRMEGGAVEAHRAWWRGLIEWAASGVREPIVAHVPTAVVPGTLITVRLEAVRPADARWPEAVDLTRPDGRTERLPVAPTPSGQAGSDAGASRRARFLADVPGEYRLSWAEDAETGLLVGDGAPAPDPADVALLALASGTAQSPGRPLPPDGAPGPDDRPRDARPWSPDGHRPLPAALAYALAALLLAEWALRRRAGGP